MKSTKYVIFGGLVLLVFGLSGCMDVPGYYGGYGYPGYSSFYPSYNLGYPGYGYGLNGWGTSGWPYYHHDWDDDWGHWGHDHDWGHWGGWNHGGWAMRGHRNGFGGFHSGGFNMAHNGFGGHPGGWGGRNFAVGHFGGGHFGGRGFGGFHGGGHGARRC
jgi:hypothetical protein